MTEKKTRTKSQSGKLAKRKGQEGERQVAAAMMHLFPGAKRTIQSRGGGAEVPDIGGIPPFHVEVKWWKRDVNPRKALAQARGDVKRGESDKIPIAVTRGNNRDFVVTLTLADFIRMLALYGDAEKLKLSPTEAYASMRPSKFGN